MLLEHIETLKKAAGLEEEVLKMVRKAFSPKMDVLIDLDEAGGEVTLRLGRDSIAILDLMKSLKKLDVPLTNIRVATTNDTLGRPWLSLIVSLEQVGTPESPAEKG